MADPMDTEEGASPVGLSVVQGDFDLKERPMNATEMLQDVMGVVRNYNGHMKVVEAIGVLRLAESNLISWHREATTD